jgi:nicotinamide-nucleotide amidase
MKGFPKTMIAEILATGEEIRSGAVIDSNSSHIAQKLEEAGIHVVRHNCVGDDFNALVSILHEIAKRSDLAVVSGGLGPTEDDLTAAAAAKAAGVDLAFDPLALKTVEAFFAARNRKMTEISRKQAMLPEGAECLSNPVGTAPGFCLTINQCLFFFLPGVPHEMRQMLATSVLPRIFELLGKNRYFYRVKTLSSFGLTESLTAERLYGFESAFADIKLGLRVKFPEIQIKLYTSGSNEDDLNARLTRASCWVMEKIENHIFSEKGDSMPKVIGDLLKERNETLAIAESCTGGLISDMITDVPGSSDYFIFSAITYSNQAKEEVLGVSISTLKKYGAVHEQTAKEMAAGVRRVSGATYGLSTSGIAGPDGGTKDKPVGTICIGLATPHGSNGRRFTFTDYDRARNKQFFAMIALDILRRGLLGIEPIHIDTKSTAIRKDPGR